MQHYQTAAARILLALVFLGPILLRINNILNIPDGYIQYQLSLGQVGLGPNFAPLLILVQTLIGVALFIGYKTKLCAYIFFVLAIFLAIVLGRLDFQSMFIYFGVAGGMFFLTLYPQTGFSLDNRKK